MQSMVDDPAWAAQFSVLELVEKTGTQGVELLNWLAARAAVPGAVRKVHSNYHIPISNTAAATMVLDAA
jgi:protocatechuate 4,5-dioxygenase, beta chain